jgi:hypothetical protein
MKNNGKKGGPRTPEGKVNSKFNAMIHGFFAKELALNDQEKRQLETIRRNLQPQLLPQTVFQGIGFGRILTCIGRCKLAVRQEMRRVRQLFGESAAQPAQSEPPEGPMAATAWYLSGRQGLREGMRLLDAVKAEFLNLGRIDARWHAALDKAFGADFRQLLTQWTPPDGSGVLLANQIKEHSKRYGGGKLPFPLQEPGSEVDGEKTPKVILDPEQSQQMVTKLFDVERSLLLDLWKSLDQRASESARAQNDAVDFAPRYFTTAFRDLDRAVASYMKLKKKSL